MPVGRRDLKAEIILELLALANTGIRDTAPAVERIVAGDYDATIADFEAISVTDAADLILDLVG